MEFLERLVLKLAVCFERVEYFVKGNVRIRDASLNILKRDTSPSWAFAIHRVIWGEINRLNCEMLNSYQVVRDFVFQSETSTVLSHFGREMRS